ncbi:amino acid permease/ SLC12A domain-containing protein [Absidia repens]|uniref:Amino acid permease/ SLC12A domain-containing protein n=1 Tax=Absidia repens TaxID=90262 RepID=A0A1X2ISI2_9FUNG|nr:amino acid permease/ SLC12A domain-containing protein [Absidia repens]
MEDGEKREVEYTNDKGEYADASEDVNPMEPLNLHRQLKNRHIAMISIGGAIGTGLFLGTSKSLASGGPAGLLLGFIVMGTIVFAMMNCLGEMVAYLPVPGGHIKLAERFVSPAFSFAMGWNYWYNWTVVLPTELSAAAVLVNYWIGPDRISNAVWIVIFLLVVVVINFFGAKAYGEAEFWFASIKILTIIGLIILGIIIDAGGAPPNHEVIGVKYWHDPGPWVQFHGIPGSLGRFLGFFSVLMNAAFSFIGTEIVAIAAGETSNPRRNIPKAVNKVYIRIVLFYVLGTFIIGLLVPSNDPALLGSNDSVNTSPFVIAIKNANIQALPHIINACLLSSAWSAASSDLYTSSRALYGLAIAGNAPKIFTRVSKKRGLPYIALIFCSLFSLLAFMGITEGSNKVFGWFQGMTSMCGMITWTCIAITYLRFYYGMKAQGIDRSTIPFKAPLQPYMGYYVVISTTIIMLFMAIVLFLGATFFRKSRFVRASEMDFHTGIAEIEAEAENEVMPTTLMGKFFEAL